MSIHREYYLSRLQAFAIKNGFILLPVFALQLFSLIPEFQMVRQTFGAFLWDVAFLTGAYLIFFKVMRLHILEPLTLSLSIRKALFFVRYSSMLLAAILHIVFVKNLLLTFDPAIDFAYKATALLSVVGIWIALCFIYIAGVYSLFWMKG